MLPDYVSSEAPEYTPTAEEIRATCAEIQSEWSATERRQRECGRRRPVIRTVRCAVEIGVSSLGMVNGDPLRKHFPMTNEGDPNTD